MISKELLEQIFVYNKTEGRLYRKGKPAGTVAKPKKAKTSYRQISVKGRFYREHRLIWLIEHGEWPEQIDHIDGNGLNNKISNLRNVSNIENNRNRPRQKNNTSGVTGVTFDKINHKWNSSIWNQGKKIHIGRYECLFDAVCARKSAERSLGFSLNHGRAAAKEGG